MLAGIESIPWGGAEGRTELTSKNTEKYTKRAEQCKKLLGFPPAG